MHMLPPTRRQFLAGLAAAGIAIRGARAETSPLRIVYYATFPPLCFEQDEKMQGILPEILGKAAKDAGIDVAHQGFPWARAQAMVQNGEADAFCTNPTDERRAYALFTELPAYVAPVSLFYSADNPRRAEIEQIRTIDDLKTVKQGDYNGNGFAETTFKGLAIEWSPNLLNTLTKVSLSRNDVFVGNDTVAKYLIKQNNIGGVKSFPVAIGKQSAFHLGVRKTLPNAQAIVDAMGRAIQAVHDSGFDREVALKYT